jgi:caffeoyl-CoA O-methyltransferase
MFHDMPPGMLARMRELEAIDARDRDDGTEHARRLRQVPPETGRFLALLAAAAPPGAWIEIGTSAAYSTMWLALAARARGATLTTYELLAEKVALARETIRRAGIGDVVTLVQGDARAYLAEYTDIAFRFLDAEKNVYAACYDLCLPRLVSGGLLVLDNAISQADELGPLLARTQADERVDAALVPIGTGDLVCRRL